MAVIEYKDVVVWRDARGRWQCRRVPSAREVVYRSGARTGPKSAGEALRARLWAAKRSPAADTAPIDEAALRRRHARALRDRMNAVPKCAGETPAARLAHVRLLRAWLGLEKPDPRIVAADCAHRFRRW
jgi:hypothetical protein